MRRLRISFISGRRGIGDDAAIAERARSPFGAALKPAENFSVGNDLRGVAHQIGFGEFGDEVAFVRECAGVDGAARFVA